MPPLLCLIGPTGSGKTAVGLRLCELLNGEIISADSMQIYRGCDLASAKPTAQEQARARHHLIDIVEPWQTYSAAAWAHDARAAIADITTRGKQPIVVGGTGFYLKALLSPETLATVPPDPALRRELEAQLQTKGSAWAHAALQASDPAAAARLHHNDTRRIIRALEVAAFRGPNHEPKVETAEPIIGLVYGLELPRELLYKRLDARIETMLAAGFLRELKSLRSIAKGRRLPALQGLGYKQMLSALDDPTVFAACVALWKRDTRHYAKRQFTWFRHQLPTCWQKIEPEAHPNDVAATVAALWRDRDSLAAKV